MPSIAFTVTMLLQMEIGEDIKEITIMDIRTDLGQEILEIDQTDFERTQSRETTIGPSEG